MNVGKSDPVSTLVVCVDPQGVCSDAISAVSKCGSSGMPVASCDVDVKL